RRERAATLNVGAGDVDKSIARRTRDWSQVRPEWGLARNASFIAARRARTRGIDLEGRAFLHDYDCTADEGWKVLELIMTAPMVVASWINLQYYGSAVNREAFGSGNKTLHNVVGTLGVLEGNGGDLRVGLPSQAVHDGSRLFHEPVRLNVLIEAPTAQIDTILEKHDKVRELVSNGWIHLLAIGEEGQVQLRDPSEGHWIAVG
ncbi:MAG: putative inorganic carbon transporter subunit DabA, partial [Polyangiales bacterium]